MPTSKQFLGTYLSSYNSDSLDYQCQPHEYNPWSTHAPTTRHNLISYRYQSEAHNYQCQIKGHNPLIKTMNHTNMFRDQSTLLLLGAIWLAIDINRKLATINSKLNNTIHKTESDYSLAVNNTEFLYQLRYISSV